MTRKLTRAEVSEHNSNKSAWIIIGNKVFDVTKFLDEHPGGCEVLLEKAGEDRTEAFEDVGHSTDAREMREQYYVGDIVDEEKELYSYDKKPTPVTSTSGKDNNGLESLIYPGLLIVCAILLYYLFMA
uniref:Cytochrome b5 heme-binding domain-containing protein n=1 Tax=Panagrolaimus sp. JU765 TaxID=591449 RepID=A0AC34Q4W2_9BILA